MKLKQHNISFKRLIMSFVQLNSLILFKQDKILFKRLIMSFVQLNDLV